MSILVTLYSSFRHSVVIAWELHSLCQPQSMPLAEVGFLLYLTQYRKSLPDMPTGLVPDRLTVDINYHRKECALGTILL